VKRIAFLAAGFGYMVLLIEALRVAVAWWHDELAQPGWSDIAPWFQPVDATDWLNRSAGVS
jgi:hypothetical protein